MLPKQGAWVQSLQELGSLILHGVAKKKKKNTKKQKLIKENVNQGFYIRPSRLSSKQLST